MAVVAILLSSVPTVLASGEGYGPGRVGLSILAGRDHVEIGTGGIWNSRDKLHIQLDPADGWRIKNYHADLGADADGVLYSPPLTPTGNPKIGHFDYKETFNLPYVNTENEDGNPYRQTLVLDLAEDIGFMWGTPYAHLRTQGVALFVNLVRLDDSNRVVEETGAWVVPELVTWIIEEATAEDSEEVVVGDDATVADAYTGELVDIDAIEVKNTKRGKVAKKEHKNAKKNVEVDEAEELITFDGGRWGWWFKFTMGHPKTGHFIDSPVAGLSIETPTYEGITDVTAAFDYFPGEEVEIAIGSIHLGSTVADHKISPLDIFPLADTENSNVINMARLLQSLDADADPQGGIAITEGVVLAFEQAMAYYELTSIDFSDDVQVDNIINQTITFAAQLETPVLLVSVSAEDAKDHLDETLNNAMFRKNISKTPDQDSTKAKMNISTTWFPALPANATAETLPVEIDYYDEEGNFIRTATTAKPIIITYTDADPVTHAMDTWAAVSRDDGETWKRKNLSRSGDLSSFELANGEPYYGYTKKPVFMIKANKMLVAWTSKFARGGKPAYSIDIEDEYTYDDPYYTEDIFGVGGPQRSVDYAREGYPEAGEIPYSCIWTCRGVIATQKDVDAGVGEFVGDIVWFKPERMTSGRRDANLIFCVGAGGAGFGMVWQEDPKGLRPGRAIGPGPGWGGATTNHKTDIWYSYLTWGDHSKVDINFVAGGDPEHDLDHITRPKALVPMSLPVRISNNEVLNEKNMGIDTTTYADDVSYLPENLTRCVKFESGKSIVQADDPNAWEADYTNLRAMPEDHQTTMNCVNCHVPHGMEPMADISTQGSPIPLVVVDAETNDYLGGFNNGDCVSCHFSHIVPRDRLKAVTPGLDEAAKCEECEASGGIWKDGIDGTELVEAYFPYEGYPYIQDDSDLNDGTHGYGVAVEGLLADPPIFHEFVNYSGATTKVAITLGEDGIQGTADDLLLDGDTGASRGNLFLQPYTYTKDVTDPETGLVTTKTITSAWAIITYEETKGAGAGPPDNTGEEITHRDDYLPESGKNVIYHSFDFQNPDLVHPGNIMNMPQCVMTGTSDTGDLMPVLDGAGNIDPTYITTEAGENVLDWKGRPQIEYENARRGRFILQGLGAVRGSRTIMLMVYKMGMEGAGRPSDIITQRWVIPEDEIEFTYKDGKINGVLSVEGNPYRFENIVGEQVFDADAEVWYWGQTGQNVSSVTPTETTASNAEETQWDDPYGAVKVVEYTQTVENLADLSDKNRYDDSRAARGQLRGDFVMLGFSYCANWAASRNGNDKYDFFLRRSFNGGETWTTDPKGSGTEHCITWTTPSGLDQVAGTKTEECFTAGAGEFERMRNLTQLPNSKESTIEPRVVAPPGTIKVDGAWTGIPEDKQNQAVFYVAWGTSTNPKKELDADGEMVQEEPHPTDLYWSYSMDKGETYHVTSWEVNGAPINDEVGTGDILYGTPWMAKGDQEQGEVQLRQTPDGSRFYASWLDEGEEGSDIVFRRIMPIGFPVNQGDGYVPPVEVEPLDESSSDDFSGDSD
ncbi:MAG: hypothetical protein KOO60_00080 [Gemmatimonadales bacterium]|nr:hypothetical protein [Gemmatimonadales bacterium]